MGMNNFDESMVNEFRIEANEMFEAAETGLLNIDRGDALQANYNAIFRSFHSLKGAAGMFGFEALQSHMHKLENHFESLKTSKTIAKEQIDYFLLGVDVAKSILEGEEEISFDYTLFEKKTSNQSSLIDQTVKAVPTQIGKPFEFSYPAQEQKILLLRNDNFPIKINGHEIFGFDRPEDMLAYFEKDGGDIIVVASADMMKLATLVHIIHDSPVHGVIVIGETPYDLKAAPKYTISLAASDRQVNIINSVRLLATIIRKEKLLKHSFEHTLLSQGELTRYLLKVGNEDLATKIESDWGALMKEYERTHLS